MLNNMGVYTLWELVHFDMAKYRARRGGFFASKHRLSELQYVIKEAIDLFSNQSTPANPFTNEAMVNNPIAQRVVMKVCAHKADRL